jgi:pimeloyl-ACP methyl ester carboxylesterase
VVLLDPALPFVAARPDPVVTAMFALYLTPGLRRVVQSRRRQTPADLVTSTLRLCCTDPSRVPADAIARHVEVAVQRAGFPGIERDFAEAVRSVVRTVGYPHGRAYRRRIGMVTCPVLLIHGTEDRLVPVAVARAAARANPAWSVREFSGVGHVPQLEIPRQTADTVLAWLGSAGQAAARAARPPARA